MYQHLRTSSWPPNTSGVHGPFAAAQTHHGARRAHRAGQESRCRRTDTWIQKRHRQVKIVSPFLPTRELSLPLKFFSIVGGDDGVLEKSRGSSGCHAQGATSSTRVSRPSGECGRLQRCWWQICSAMSAVVMRTLSAPKHARSQNRHSPPLSVSTFLQESAEAKVKPVDGMGWDRMA